MRAAPSKAPWRDRNGRFSLLKAVVFLLLPVPALVQGVEWALFGLSGHPSQTALLLTGFWADRLLVLTLAVTPLATLFALPRLTHVRRMLGVATAAYAAAHLGVYAFQQNFAWGFVFVQMVSHPVLTIGLASLLGLVALAITSTDNWIRRLGRGWKRLHLLVHPAIVLALLHSFMEAPTDVTLSATCAGFYLWLLGWRFLPKSARRQPTLLFTLALCATAATALIEAGWYAIATGLPADRILEANLSLVAGIRPAQWVALGGFAIAAAMAVRSLIGPMNKLPMTRLAEGGRASTITLPTRETRR
ncbi:MAG TPA: ferric reductase-like transmembrane domain-containing protein [Acetobacteraceae bacterium]|nr:ferric reductase-like transmembrane domain-containing protein [Acetobacteraceae bacterium]